MEPPGNSAMVHGIRRKARSVLLVSEDDIEIRFSSFGQHQQVADFLPSGEACERHEAFDGGPSRTMNRVCPYNPYNMRNLRAGILSRRGVEGDSGEGTDARPER